MADASSRDHPTPIGWGAVIFAVALSIFWIALGSSVIATARTHDFLNLYTGASLALEGSFSELHERDVQLTRERALVPRTTELIPFVRPHFYALLLAPLALFPFDAALWVWIGLHMALLAGCWVWGARRFGSDALIFGALYLPTAIGIAHGQDGVFMLAIAIAAYRLAEHEREEAAGAVLALGLMKFHLLLLVPPALVLQKRWRMLAGFCAAGAVEVSLSFVLGGWQGAMAYIELLRARDLNRLLPSPELTISAQGLAANFGLGRPAYIAALAGLVVVLTAVGVWRAPLWRFFSVALVGSLLAVPHVYGYDASILLLPVWLIQFRSNRTLSRLAALCLAAPLVFFFSFLEPPWSAAPSLTLLLLLSVLAWENYRDWPSTAVRPATS